MTILQCILGSCVKNSLIIRVTESKLPIFLDALVSLDFKWVSVASDKTDTCEASYANNTSNASIMQALLVMQEIQVMQVIYGEIQLMWGIQEVQVMKVMQAIYK